MTGFGMNQKQPIGWICPSLALRKVMMDRLKIDDHIHNIHAAHIGASFYEF